MTYGEMKKFMNKFYNDDDEVKFLINIEDARYDKAGWFSPEFQGVDPETRELVLSPIVF